MKIPVALLRLIAVAAAAVALFLTFGRAQEPLGVGSPAGEKKPNVLFISIDDLNDWVEPLGGVSPGHHA